VHAKNLFIPKPILIYKIIYPENGNLFQPPYDYILAHAVYQLSRHFECTDITMINNDNMRITKPPMMKLQ